METSAVNDFDKSLTFNCSSFEDFSQIISRGLECLEEVERSQKTLLHAQLCQKLISSCNEWVGYHPEHTSLLMYAGPVKALEIINSNISKASLQGSQWLEGVVLEMMKNGTFEVIMGDQSLNCSPNTEKLLINGLSRYPDLFSSKRGRQVSDQFLPINYYRRLATCILNSLEYIHSLSLNGGTKKSKLTFLASLIGKVSMLGHRDSFYGGLIPKLEEVTRDDSHWSDLCHSLFMSIPQYQLEATLDGIMHHVTPSLRLGSPLWRILGTLPLHSPHASYLLTNKYVIIRPLSDPRVLVGYLGSDERLHPLLMESILLSLRLWSDESALRHMTAGLHLQIAGHVVLGVNLIDLSPFQSQLSELTSLVMQGIQVHLQCPLDEFKYVGMAAGEYIMNLLHPSSPAPPSSSSPSSSPSSSSPSSPPSSSPSSSSPSSSFKPLQFSYPESESIVWLKSLMKPITEQEEGLAPLVPPPAVKQDEQPSPLKERYGEGLVQSTVTNDDDSDDDDLQPYDMTNDKDSSITPSPRHLRVAIQGLLAKNEFSKHVSALRGLKNLIQSKPADLPELCLELAKILLHLEDNYSLEQEFTQLRHDSLVECVATCPLQVAPYLCEQFYSQHYNLSQRMAILEALTAAAGKLSNPLTKKVEEFSLKEPSLAPGKKPWQQIVEERVQAKTRLISKGSKKLEAVPNQFNDVCGQFFFPLISHFEANKIPTLDLQGRDSSLLGQLLYALGLIVHLAVHCPLVPLMSASLLDFCWSFKHHTDVCVRQGVLYCVSCVLATVPASSVPALMERGLNEILLWAKDVVVNDASENCRHLAQVSLSLFSEAIQQQQQ